ncbi:MAG: NAD-dependent epimerase/dehydratase family protein [Chloroflexi bacterium]|nr:NAD-dependent epimerase/dehydratase family protein [Chloroflexota bacterium]
MPQRESKRILVTGSVGQIGSELTMALRERYGADNVVASGHKTPPSPTLRDSGPFETIDVTRRETLEAVVDRYQIDTIYHMSAILSATGEQKPQLCWDVNINGLYNVLEVARGRGLARLFCPSSIAAFGPDTPQDHTPQRTILRPTTMYGVTKVSGELLCNYYVKRFGLDVRGVRYPGIISAETLPGGGTTDYAVAIFYEAIKHSRYTCFVRPDTVLPMMYMPDCIRATMMLMEAPLEKLNYHADYNLAALSFSAEELAAEVAKHVPGFVCDYQPDFRQAIADSWPCTIDDSAAREDWGWRPQYGLAEMTKDMLEQLGRRHAAGQL